MADGKPAPRGTWLRRLLWVPAGLGILLVALAIAAPAFLRSPAGLRALESLADGLPAGQLGWLEVEGVSGDPFSKVSIRRLAIRDRKGVWLEARNLSADWSPVRLLAREVAVHKASAKGIRILRAPVLRPPQPHRPLPVSISLTRLEAEIETLPAGSVRRGLYRVSGALQVRRADGGISLRLDADSRLAIGDHLDLNLDFGPGRPLRARAVALEAKGGALAGALGLPADQAFRLDLTADGEVQRGRLRADLTSGRLRPVSILGGWTPEAGQLSGRVDLAASTLTRPLVSKLGPVLTLEGQARGLKGGGGRYVARFSMRTQGGWVSVAGPINLSRQATGPEGVTVEASVPSLAQLAGAGGGGLLTVKGRLAGRPDEWRFEGDARMAAFEVAGFALADLRGPLMLEGRKGRYDLDLRARGAGGRGVGLVPALLGPSPRLDMKATRLSDGRVLIEAFDATGSGFRISGNGVRGFLGGLSFSGTGSVNRLDLALPAAGGALTGRWSARSASSEAPWRVALDLRGADFRAGLAEVDRLLGRSPVLEASLDLGPDRMRLERLVLRGAALRARSTDGVVEAGRVNAGFDWSAAGPFSVGPLEMTGKAAGIARVTGPLTEPQLVAEAAFDSIDLPGLKLTEARLGVTASPKGGSVDLRAFSPYGPASAVTDFGLSRGGLNLRNLRIEGGGLRASGEAALSTREPAQADLELAVGPGAFLAEGAVRGSLRLHERPGSGLWVDLDLAGRNILTPGERLSVAEVRLSAEGQADRLPFALTGRGQTPAGDWNLDGRGNISGSGSALQIAFDGSAEAAGRRIRTLETARLELHGTTRRARLHLGLDSKGSALLEVALGGEETFAIVRLEDLPASFLNPDLTGRLDADFRIDGRGEKLVGQGSGRLSDVRARDSDPSLGLNGRVSAGLDREALRVQASLTNSQGMSADGEVLVPVSTRAADFRVRPDREGPLRGQVRARGEIKPLWDLLVGGEQALSGQVSLSGDLSGSLSAPRAQGEAEIENGAFSDAATGLVLKNVIVRSRLSEAAIRIDRATGADGQGGVLSGSGVISLGEDTASSFRLDLLNFRVIDNDLATATASGQASVTRATDGRVTLKGGLILNRADVTAAAPTPTGVTPLAVTEINRPVQIDRRTPGRDSGPAVALDVTLKAPQNVNIRGQGLDLEMSLDARVSGTTAAPRLTGLARVVRGSYAFADKRFEIDPSGVVYLSQDPARIRLDLAAVRTDPALTATVRIRGTAARPEVTLTSSPPLPTDEIFSQILFGRSASQLSPLETAQLASAVAAMAGGGALDVVGNLRGLAGLDRLTFAGGADGEDVEVSGGKYLTDNVLLIVTGGGRDGGSAQVEWNVSRSLSLISKLSGQGGNTLSVRWRRDY